MTSDNKLTIWNQPEWLKAVHEWIHGELARQQIPVMDSIEQIHVRPWSTILRVPTEQGICYFKATSDNAAHEVALTAYLSGVNADCMPQLLAVDPLRGWLLMRDGGARLRETLQAQPDFQHWETLLPLYARLQIEASNHLPDLLALGVPNRSLAQLPQQYGQLLTQKDVFYIDSPHGISAAEYQRLLDLSDVFRARCEALAGCGIPESVHHGDLHDGNIFLSDGGYRFMDWGDCSISHPFFSLRTAYVSAEIRFNLEEGSPELERLRDAYLIAWREYQTEEKLLAAFALAQQLWAISSALIWHQAIANLDETQRGEYAHAIPSLAQEFLAGISE